MGDTQKGRLYRIAPRDSKWTVPAAEIRSAAGAVAALGSPNLCTRATALDWLAAHPHESREPLAEARAQATDARLRARLAWASALVSDQPETLSLALASESEEMQVVALRMRRQSKSDVVGLVEKLAASAGASVVRECAIALRGIAGERADRAWAECAARHTAGDRWSVEALGIGADAVGGFEGPSQWDGRLAAWRATVGEGWKSPAGREVIWRSRAAETPRLLCELIGDPATTTSESLALVRALDFQDRTLVLESLRPLVKRFTAPEEKLRIVLPELVVRLDAGDAADAVIAQRIDEAAGYAGRSQAFVEIALRFLRVQSIGDLIALASAESTAEQLAAFSAGAVLDLGGDDAVKRAAAAADPAGLRLLTAVGILGSGEAVNLLKGLISDDKTPPQIRATAVQSLARSNPGAKEIVAMAKAGALTGQLPQVAAVAIASCPWGDVRKAASDALPMPKAKGGSLPPLRDLLKRGGRADRGKVVFGGAGTCAKCHVVGGEGTAVGPNLSGIGGKLSKAALYESILAPSAAISHNYETYTALLDDGRSLTGLLVSQSTDHVVIRGADGIDVTIPAGELDELVKQPVSLMPADLATLLSADELVDLVAWLETLKQAN
jgi:putative heme-binding domain-containing protein